MELIFLGTGAGMPSIRRNVTAIALRFSEDRSAFWLFDCGEATQHQVMRSPLKLSKLEMFFITHLHGDHLFGLPGVLTSRSNQGVKTPLRVLGPEGLRAYIETTLAVSGSYLGYELHVTELGDTDASSGEPFYEDERYRICCGYLEHRITCLGYRIEEKNRPGKLDAGKLAAAGVPAGPLYKRLKSGENVVLDDGTVLVADHYLSAPVQGRVVAIMGDTKATGEVRRLAAEADVLVHEATFGRDAGALAAEYYHSTTADAAEAAAEAQAGALILTHISARYQDESDAQLLAEARALFPNTYIAEDYWIYPILNKRS